MKVYQETEAKLFNSDSPWFGVLDPRDNTIAALFWDRRSAEQFVRNEAPRWQVVEVRVSE